MWASTALVGIAVGCAIVLVGTATSAQPGPLIPGDRAANLRAPSGQAAPPVPDRAMLNFLLAQAKRRAAENGEPSFKRGEVYRTTRQLANAAVRAGVVDSDQPVYLVILHGDFTGYAMPLGGGRPPQAPYLNFIIDANTRELTDWGLLGDLPETSTLPPPIPLRSE